MFKNTTPNYLKPPTYETPVESIKLDMDFYGIPHWGWAIFRTAYGSPEFDSSWEKLQARIKCQSATEMAEPGVPNEVAAGLNWVFLSDRLTLQGKTRHDARLKFLEWVAQQPRITDPRYGPPSRYLYFVHVDEEVLDSGGTPGEEPHFVKLVRCEERQDLVYDFVSREELRKYSEEEDGDEGWMRVAVDMLGAEFYDSLGDMPEYFYVYYRGHPNVVEW
ncbi:hypothetical protein B0T14DRAFT_517197 [Immersiella caudata]|uniref:Uncharacterized protein n=1 Tax=Immersiella caudata TaxID=314043 RepID=A0AA39WYC0_9PEZI|nr:hypothetical protein B0T14DRAFT_517197 [Immersiella caudata]